MKPSVVNGRDVWCLIGERDYLSQRLGEMEGVIAMAQAEIEKARQENETLRYQLKQMLGKIFKSRIKPNPKVNRPQRGAPRGHRGIAEDSQKKSLNLLTFIPVNVISAAPPVRPIMREILMSM